MEVVRCIIQKCILDRGGQSIIQKCTLDGGGQSIMYSEVYRSVFLMEVVSTLVLYRSVLLMEVV